MGMRLISLSSKFIYSQDFCPIYTIVLPELFAKFVKHLYVIFRFSTILIILPIAEHTQMVDICIYIPISCFGLAAFYLEFGVTFTLKAMSVIIDVPPGKPGSSLLGGLVQDNIIGPL